MDSGNEGKGFGGITDLSIEKKNQILSSADLPEILKRKRENHRKSVIGKMRTSIRFK